MERFDVTCGRNSRMEQPALAGFMLEIAGRLVRVIVRGAIVPDVCEAMRGVRRAVPGV